MDKPTFITDELELEGYLNYLDDLRESGATNMWGGARYMRLEFPDLTEEQSSQVLFYWMHTFGERNQEGE